MHIIVIPILFILSFAARVWIRLGRKDFGIDTWYFLNYAQGFREKRRLPVILKNYILDIEEQWYPPVIPFLISLFPKRIADAYHWAFSAIVDSLHAILLYIFSFFLTGSLEISVFACLFYITSTFNASMATNLNARSFASLALTTLMLLLYNFTVNQNALNFVLVLVAGALLLNTHKTATQQFLFFCIGFALLNHEPVYLYIIVCVFAAALAATKGFYTKIFRNNIQIIRYWSKNIPFMWKHQVYDSELYKNEEKAALKAGVSGMKKNKLMFFLARFQLVLFLFIAIILMIQDRYPVAIPNASFFYQWVLINYLTVIATTYLPFFKLMGEGYNYILYGTFPVSLLVAYATSTLLPDKITAFSVFFILLLLNLTIQLFTLNRQRYNNNAYVDEEMKGVIGLLKNIRKDNILCLPVFKAEAVAYLAQKRVFWGGHGSGWDRLHDFYTVIRVPIEKLMHRYHIKLVFIDKRFVDAEDLRIDSLLQKIYDGRNYSLFRVNQQDPA